MSFRDSLWAPERRALSVELADANAVTLRAAAAEDAGAVLDDVLREGEPRPVVWLDVGRTVLSSRTVRELARQTALTLTGGQDLLAIQPETRSPDQTRRLLDARRALGSAFAFLDGESVKEPLAIAACLEALARHAQESGRRALLVLVGAERALIDKQLMQMLWAVRGTAQTLSRLTVVFCGGPGVSELTDGPKAAFYGWGSELSLRVDEKTLAGLVDRRLATAQIPEEAQRTAQRVAELCGSSIATAEQLSGLIVSHILDRDPLDVADAWNELVRQEAPRLRVLAATTAAVNVQALPVATTIAAGEHPYKTQGTYDTAIRRALSGLGAVGVTERTGVRGWRIVDPLFAAWLREQ